VIFLADACATQSVWIHQCKRPN